MSTARQINQINMSKLKRRGVTPAIETLERRALLATIVVTGTGDAVAADGVVTLREALTAASTNAASGDANAGDPGLDRIEFNILGTGVHTITLATTSPLNVGRDSADEPVLIDGYSQPGAAANTNPIGAADNAVLKIEIRSSGTNTPAVGLSVRSGGNTIRGLAVGGFSFAGIVLTEDSRFPLGGNVIAGDFIGTDASGTAAVPNGTGVSGISPGNTIGGTSPADRNLISGNAGDGLNFVNSNALLAGPVIRGNFIGTDATGLLALGNGGAGISIEGFTGATIGGAAAGARNVIAASGGYGIDGVFNHAVIQGNYVGTGITGNTPLFNPTVPNNADLRGGIRDNVPNITVGGTAAGAGNIVASQGEGIAIGSNSAPSGDALIQGNAVGTNFDGTAVLGNVGYGITVSSPGATIGGTAAGAANVVANTAFSFGTAGYGINFIPDAGMIVSGNSVFKNAGVGVFGGLAFAPILTSVSGSRITGRLDRDPNATDNAPPQPGATYHIEFFRTPNTGGASDDQQGRFYLGSVDVTTDANKHADFAFDAGSPLPAGQFVTATATGLIFTPTVGTTSFSNPIRTDAAPASADLGVSVSDAPDPVAAGTLLTYTITVTNGGPGSAAAPVLATTITHTGETFVSLATPAGWTATTPAVGGTGAISATAATLPSGPTGTAVFTLVARVDASAAAGSNLGLTAGVSSSTADPNSANDGATATTVVSAAAPPDSADLSVQVVDTPDPVASGSLLTYNLTARNGGPIIATTPVLTTAVPAGTTFVSFAAPAGWVVGAPAAGGTGAITAGAPGLFGDAAATRFVLVVRLDPGTAPGSTLTLGAAIASSTPDPATANNAATVTTSVTTPIPPDLFPKASPDAYATAAGHALKVAAPGVLANDSIPGGGQLVVRAGQGTAHGTLALNPDGSFTYVPDAGFSGTDGFTYFARSPLTGAVSRTPAAVAITVAAATPPPGPDTTGPAVVGLVRYGYHAQPTHLVVAFDEALDQAASTRLANFGLAAAGPDGRFGTRDDAIIPLKSATIGVDGRSIVITTRRPLPLRHRYRLMVHGPTDLAGNALDFHRDGQTAGPAVLPFDRRILAGPSVHPAHASSVGKSRPHRRPHGSTPSTVSARTTERGT